MYARAPADLQSGIDSLTRVVFLYASNSPRSKAAKDLARAAVISAVVVGGALADGGVHVLSEAADATGDVIEHRYGVEVGASSRDGLQVLLDKFWSRLPQGVSFHHAVELYALD